MKRVLLFAAIGAAIGYYIQSRVVIPSLQQPGSGSSTITGSLGSDINLVNGALLGAAVGALPLLLK